MKNIETYNPSRMGGKKEVKMMREYNLQLDDARIYFKNCIKPKLDRAYKLYISYNGDRADELKKLGKKWMANIFVPYIQATVETLMPRILDARPDFTVQGRTEEDQIKSEKIQQLCDYTWEISGMDTVAEDSTRASLIYGMGYLQVGWKKDVREYEFLDDKELKKKKMKWKKEKRTFYDAPFCEAVDNYSLWYDWHNIPAASKQYWFKRLLLTEADIRRRYPYAEEKRLIIALASNAGDLEDYSSVRRETKFNHDTINKGDDFKAGSSGLGAEMYKNQATDDLNIYEVIEWWRPFQDKYAVMVNDIPVLRKGQIPNPYDFKDTPFIGIPFLKLPFEYEGKGLPLILESPQIMLNTMKNQRLDAVTLNIHKMWIVNPLANINKDELVVRPFGIVYSADPNGVREIQFSDVKQSAYREEELLKSDMRYASGVDDFSMGAGGGGASATEVRHLRESTLERIRLYINHLGEAYSEVMRKWISMYGQFFTEDMIIRITGDDGADIFPLIQKDDLTGQFDFKASVLPSIAGKNDIDKKQNMDLFQLLQNMEFVDQEKLVSKMLHSWNWTLESIKKGDEQQMGPDGMPMPGMPGMGQEGMPPEGMPPEGMPEEAGPQLPGGEIPQDVIDAALSKLGPGAAASSPSGFSEASSPINLLQEGGSIPPTVKGVGANPRGLNRTGKVNTNISTKPSADANIASQASNIQS